MYRFVRAGVLAAVLQTALVTIVAFVAILNGGTEPVPFDSNLPSPDGSSVGDLDLLALIDVLTAICVSLLRAPSVVETARHMRHGFFRLSARHPERVAGSLITQCFFASAGCAALALRPPPLWFLSFIASVVGTDSGFLVWPAMMSIGIAAFGANAHAALLGNPD